MRVHVDRERCQGHNRCYALAPDLFEIDDYGYWSDVNGGVVPTEFEEKARLAVANCPEYAISISEGDENSAPSSGH
jgi:ferredoxin